MSGSAPTPTVQPTGWRATALAALVGGAVGFGLFFALDRLHLALPVPPLLAAGALAVVALVVGWQAWSTRKTLHRRHETLQPTAAVALLALGKTALIAGAALAGAYAGIAVHTLPHLEAQLPRERIVGALASMLASIGLAIAGRMLERACEIPNPPPDDQTATPGEDPSEGDAQG